MKINITKDKAKYIVNEEQRKVICIIPKTSELFFEYAYENLPIRPNCDAENYAYSKLCQKLHMPNKFVGIATCSSDDEWDVEKGKLLAFSRAKTKLNKCFFKRANIYVDTIDELLEQAVNTINRYGRKVSAVTDRREKKIAEMIGVDDEA